MAGKTTDPKEERLTFRLSEEDLKALRAATPKEVSLGATMRKLIRERLPKDTTWWKLQPAKGGGK